MLNMKMVDKLEFWYTIFNFNFEVQNTCSTPGFHAAEFARIGLKVISAR